MSCPGSGGAPRDIRDTPAPWQCSGVSPRGDFLPSLPGQPQAALGMSPGQGGKEGSPDLGGFGVSSAGKTSGSTAHLAFSWHQVWRQHWQKEPFWHEVERKSHCAQTWLGFWGFFPSTSCLLPLLSQEDRAGSCQDGQCPGQPGSLQSSLGKLWLFPGDPHRGQLRALVQRSPANPGTFWVLPLNTESPSPEGA